LVGGCPHPAEALAAAGGSTAWCSMMTGEGLSAGLDELAPTGNASAKASAIAPGRETAADAATGTWAANSRSSTRMRSSAAKVAFEGPLFFLGGSAGTPSDGAVGTKVGTCPSSDVAVRTNSLREAIDKVFTAAWNLRTLAANYSW
jgi:hypothetical protein